MDCPDTEQIPPESPQQLVAADVCVCVCARARLVAGTAAADAAADAAAAATFLNQSVSGVCAIPTTVAGDAWYIFIYKCIYVYIYMYICICLYVYMYMFICIYVYICVYIYLCLVYIYSSRGMSLMSQISFKKEPDTNKISLWQ